MPEAGATERGFGRVVVFFYGLLAFAVTGRATFELTTKFGKAPFPYGLSIAAALIYIVATWALATRRSTIALVAVTFEMVGVLVVGTLSVADRSAFPEASAWSVYGVDYGCLPLVLPFVGMWWVLRNRETRSPE